MRMIETRDGPIFAGRRTPNTFVYNGVAYRWWPKGYRADRTDPNQIHVSDIAWRGPHTICPTPETLETVAREIANDYRLEIERIGREVEAEYDDRFIEDDRDHERHVDAYLDSLSNDPDNYDLIDEEQDRMLGEGGGL